MEYITLDWNLNRVKWVEVSAEASGKKYLTNYLVITRRKFLSKWKSILQTSF